MFAKKAAELIGDNNKFVVIIEGTKTFAKNIIDHYTNRYDSNPQPEEILRLVSIKIVKDSFNSETLAVKLLEMGLDENIDYVTIIKPVDE